MKRFLLVSIGILYIQLLFAQIPADYYDDAEGLNGDALKVALHDIITSGHIKLSYTPGVWEAYEITDVFPSPNNTTIWDMYSDDPEGTPSYTYEIYTDQCGNYSVEGDCYNREHSFPKSWWGGFDNDENPQYSDLNHLFATDGKVNGMRDNYPFGEVGTASWTSTNGSKLGSCAYAGYSGTVFEPIDKYKGDFARAYFYMAIRYKDEIPTWVANYGGTFDIDEVFENNGDFKDWFLNMLIEWHNNDPVSQKELFRNEAVYDEQKNANPFIDHPEYVAQIWGGEGVYISNVSKSPESPTSADVVTVSASITSSGGTITTANLKWGTTSGTHPNTVPMTASKGSYSADIPAQTEGTTVYYIIEAEDDNAETSSTSEYSYTVDDNSAIVIVDEDFTSCPASGWTIYSLSGSNNWDCTSGYVQVNAYWGDAAGNDWFISPALNLDSYMNEVLTFTSWTQWFDNSSSDPDLSVKYSTNYSGTGDPSLATWIDLSASLSSENSQVWTESGNIDLSFINGSSVYIAFHYMSTSNATGYAEYWKVDDILITGTASTSGLPQITNVTNTPELPSDEDDVTISATITDDGTISLAEIKWGTTSGNYPNFVTMTNSGDVYSGVITAQSGGTTVYYVIRAEDNEAGITLSSEFDYTVEGSANQAPVISDVLISPTSPTENDDVTISATITDDGTISLAEIKWGTTSGNYPNSVTMTNSGDVYSGVIPAQSGGTIVYYVIKAEDNEAGITLSPEFNYAVEGPANQAPVISDVLISPTSPTENDNVTVTAIATDSDGTIMSVLLNWNLSTEPVTEVPMNFSGGKYYGSIPKQSIGETIYFSIIAEDDKGLQGKYDGDYEVSESNGIYRITDNNIQLFPNPTSQVLNINIENYNGIVEIKMYDILGVTVLNKKVDFTGRYKLILEDLDSGIYFIKFDIDNVLITKRIIVEK